MLFRSTERNLGLALAEFRNYQRGVMPAGPGARELTALFARIDTAVTTPAPGDVKIHNSDRDILNLLSKQAATLHLGIANYCWLSKTCDNQHYGDKAVMRTCLRDTREHRACR